MKFILHMLIINLTSMALTACSAHEKVIGLRENIHHDDFEYSVQSVDKTPTIGARHASGMFYIVTFQVENRARRVNHRWNNRTGYIVDGTGIVYENDSDAQKQLNQTGAFGYKDEYTTPAGATETTRFVFDIPEHVAKTYLQVRGDVLMGDVFDGNQYKKTKVKLF